MTTPIVVAFTLKGQSESQIIATLTKVAQKYDGALLIHGFLPRDMVIAKGWSTGILDAFDNLFPRQVKCFSNSMTWRQDMAVVASRMGATVIVIGDVKEGVQEEVAKYSELQLVIEYYPLEGQSNG